MIMFAKKKTSFPFFSHLAGFGARPSCVAAFGHEAMDCGLLSTGNLAMGKPCGKAMWVF
jgi:hypothetical protein